MSARPPRTVARTITAACAALAGAAGAGGCAPGIPRIDHGPGAPAAPSALWPVPQAVRVPPPDTLIPTAPAATLALAEDSASAAAVSTLSLADVLDLALRNSPTTRASWAIARAQANFYGAARGALYPSINANVNLTRVGGTGAVGTGTGTGTTVDTTGTGTGTRSGAGAAASVGDRTFLTPSITLSYLIFDFGGRSGAIEAARQQAIVADLAHNAAVRDVILQVESALFTFLADRALYRAQEVAVSEAGADLAQASARHRVGLAAQDEVLLARTALGQQRLSLVALEADTAIARGALATAMGLPANARFTVPDIVVGDSVEGLTASVDSLIARATVERAELAEAQAQARSLAAQVRVARSAGYPALVLNATRSYVRGIQGGVPNTSSYAVVLGLQIPIFAGFSHRYDVRAVREQYEAALANLEATRLAVTVQVYTSYYALQAAAKSVTLSSALVRDAALSADVAAGQYREGVGTIIDLLTARAALIAARAQAIQARWEWRTALVQLGHDVGVLDLAGSPQLLPGSPPATTEVP